MRKHNLKDVLLVKNEKICDCSAEVAKWNYWDHEHLDVIHDSYVSSDCLYEKNNVYFCIHKIKIPIFSFLHVQTPMLVIQQNETTMYSIVQQLGIISKTTITINPINDKKCKIEMNYEFYLNGWRKILKPLLKRLIPIWSERVYREDLPIKLRRQKYLELGFKDFQGMPPLENRQPISIKKTVLPIPRPKKSIRDLHPLKIK